jgi:homoserine O-acetyltransferase
MKIRAILVSAAACAMLSLATYSAMAQSVPAAKEGTWVARDFHFHTGEVLPELRLNYRTVGEPSGEPVLILHGTTQSGAAMLGPVFAGELFNPGLPLDAAKYFVILPNALGHGNSSKPSDGMRAKFPRYNYDDMVLAQYRLVSEGLGVRHLRLVLGNSMGGMNTWIWGTTYPDFMDALVPMASQPSEMSSRNWMMRRLIIDTIPQRPRLEGRRLHRAAEGLSRSGRVLRRRQQRRHLGIPEDGTNAGGGRQAARPAAIGTFQCRRQRFSLSVGLLA